MRSASATVTRFFVPPLRQNAAEHLADIAPLSARRRRRSCRLAGSALLDFDLDQPHVVETALDLAARSIADALDSSATATSTDAAAAVAAGEAAAKIEPSVAANGLPALRRGGRVSGWS